MKGDELSSDDQQYIEGILSNCEIKMKSAIQSVTTQYEPIMVSMFKMVSKKHYECSQMYNRMDEISKCSEEMNKIEQAHQKNIGVYLQGGILKFSDCSQLAMDSYKKSKNKSDFSNSMERCINAFTNGFEKQFITIANNDVKEMQKIH